MLKNDHVDAKIKIPSLEVQTERSNKLSTRQFVEDLINKGQYETSLEALRKADSILMGMHIEALDYINFMRAKPIEILSSLKNEFTNKLTLNFINIDEIESALKEINNPLIDMVVGNAKNHLEKERVRIESELDKELQIARSKINRSALDRFVDDLRDKIMTDDIAFKEGLRDYRPLKKEKVLEWLACVSDDPKLLLPLRQHPIFVSLLIHCIYLGEAAKVKEIYDKLSLEDQKVISSTLKSSNINVHFHATCLPDSLYTFFLSSPEHPFNAALVDLLAIKACDESALKNIYLIDKHCPEWFKYVSKSFTSTREQVEEFYDLLRKEDFVDMNSEGFSKVLVSLLPHINGSGWYDLIATAPKPLLDKFLQIDQNVVVAALYINSQKR